jgi:hypothetical protein
MPSKQPATKRLFFSVHSYGDSSVGPIKAKVAQSRLSSAKISYSDRSATTTGGDSANFGDYQTYSFGNEIWLNR